METFFRFQKRILIKSKNNIKSVASFFFWQTWLHVLSFLDVRSLAADVALVSHAFHDFTCEPHLWRAFTIRDFATYVLAPALSSMNAYPDIHPIMVLQSREHVS